MFRVWAERSRSILLDHYFGGLDNCGDGIALSELEFVGATPGDGTLKEIVTDPHDHRAMISPSSISLILPRSLFLADIGMSSLMRGDSA